MGYSYQSYRETVARINEKMFYSELSEHCYFKYLEYVETPSGDYVNYMGNYLWDSENDPREWVNDDEQESLESYLIKEVRKVNKVVQESLRLLEKAND